MRKVIILYNPLSGSGQGKQDAEKLKEKGEMVDITKIKDYKEFFNGLDIKDEVIIAGGDGTISRFANDTHDMEIKNPLYYYATGTGNDFWHDMNLKKGDEPFLVNRVIDNLPSATINGKDYRFINAIGYGIDGYACEKADSLRDAGKKINYISIVIKGILYAFKPRKATITVDGKVYKYDKVWFAPVMKGRFYASDSGFEPIKCNTSLHADPNSACHCEEGRKHRRGNLPVR